MDQLLFSDRTRYLDHLRDESDRFRAALAVADPAAVVPTCPEWNAEDLLWHLTEVQLFWSAIVEGPVLEDSEIEAVESGKPARPAARSALQVLSAAATARLAAALSAAGPAAPAWSWHPADRTAGFTFRRQAHEALIHRVDAELTAGVDVSPFDPGLATDGVDEMLRIFWGIPGGGWATFHPGEHVVEFVTSDTARSWPVLLGRWTGTGPQSGREFDEPTGMAIDDDSIAPTARVRGSAADLDRWLWTRGGSDVERTGDAAVLAVVDEIIADGVE